MGDAGGTHEERRPRIALLAPMALELDPLVRLLGLQLTSRHDSVGVPVHEGRLDRGPDRPAAEVLAVLIGVGTEPSARATTALLAAVEVDHVVVVGVAGGVLPGAAVGDVVRVSSVLHGPTGRRHVPTHLGPDRAVGTLHTSDELVLDRDELAALVARGVVALDMETAAVAQVCEAEGVPWSVVRAISDLAGDASITAEVAALVQPDGTPDLDAVAHHLDEDPTRGEALARLGRDVEHAAEAAAEAAIAACLHVRRPPSAG